MRTRFTGVALLATLALAAPAARADGWLEIYGLRMDPSDVDARQYSRPGWGGGVQGVVPLPGTANLFAGVVGVEVVNLLSTTKTFQDPLTGLRVEQQTSQNYGRFFLGGRVGAHGAGLLRPYAGLDLAGVWYGIGTDVVVPDDYNRQTEIRQSLGSRNEIAFGWDANAGVGLNFSDRWGLDFGARWLHAYGLPQQLGDGAVTIQPGYLQVKLGVGIGSRLLH
jgi:opacity protein-like surface antigen